jgi:hypothetical protein
MERRVQLDAGLSQVSFGRVYGSFPGCSTRYAVTGVAPPDLDLDQITALQLRNPQSLKASSQRDPVLGTFRGVDMGLTHGPKGTIRGGDSGLMLGGNDKKRPPN